jgi:hypothetical protein
VAEAVNVPTRSRPHIALEEIDEDELVARVSAAPVSAEDGARLADEVLEAVSEVTSEPERVPALSAG